MTGNFKRILSLDVFRGLTMALMVLVNSQGTRDIYPILDHASWNGCTLADLVFPSFLFIVGVTTVISLQRQLTLADIQRDVLYKNIFKRFSLLFLLGLFINAFPYHFDWSSLRVYGILQRIALCYLVCAVIYLNSRVTSQIILFWGLLMGYAFFIHLIPIPGWQGDQLSMNHNWVGFIDQKLFSSAHLLFKNRDPEGLLSTLPAIATTLSGVITGHFLLSSMTPRKKAMYLFFAGVIGFLGGWLWGYYVPINKNLWTSSFVLWTSGISLMGFSLCFYLIDILGYSKWSWPFKIFGMNALFIFVFHVLLLKIQAMFSVSLSNEPSDNLRVALAHYLFGYFSEENAGLLYALVFLLLNFLVALFLYRKKIFFKL